MASTNADADDKVELILKFRPLAWGFSTAFPITLVVCMIVTFTATDYSKDTDKIYAFYGMFNPCILFDHYPAKVPGAIGFLVMEFCAVCFGIMLLLYHFSTHRAIRTLQTCVFVSASSFIEACVLNIFTTNLYPEETQPHRLLHEVNHVNASKLTDEDVKVILTHTSFYVAWLLANILMSLYVAKCFLMPTRGQRKIAWSIALGIGCIGMFCHMSGTLISVVRGNAMSYPDDLKSEFQRWLLKATKYIFAHTWGWFPILYWRFVVPSDSGVRVTIWQQHEDGNRSDFGSVYPRRILSTSFQVIAVVGTLGALFHEEWESDETVEIPMAAAFRTKPYGYIATPLWFLMSVYFSAGIYLTIVQQRLQDKRYNWFLIACGAMFVASLALCDLVILEQERFSWVFMIIAGTSFMMWVIALSRPILINGGWKERLVPITYLLAVAGCLIGSCLHWVFCFFLAFCLCLYARAVSHNQPIYVSLTSLGQVDGSGSDDHQKVEGSSGA